jgi:2-oxoglutarate ferredoxin oxidoreductase subunit alpha
MSVKSRSGGAKALPAPRLEMRSGNWMAARGALAAGCGFFSGYPITPSSEIYSRMMAWLPERGGVALGAPDEITALQYAVGAALTGRRAMTATSGPGWSLMIETVQYAVMTETPVVIVVVQRLGPATGGATQGGQGDLLLVAHATSGGQPIPVLAPVDARDCYLLTADAFRLAEVLRTPVVVLSDKEIGMTIESVDLASLPEIAPLTRPATREGERFVSYRIGRPDDVPAFAPVGGPHKVTVTGSAHDQEGRLRKNDPETIRQIEHLTAKISARADDLERVRHRRAPGAESVLISFGISARTCREVVRESAAAGTPVDLLEVLSLFPVPREALARATHGMKRVVIVEENLTGLYAHEIRPFLDGAAVRQVNAIGAMITPGAIHAALRG